MGVAPRCERDRFKDLRPRVPSPETTFFWPLDLTGAVEGVERNIVTPEQRINILQAHEAEMGSKKSLTLLINK